MNHPACEVTIPSLGWAGGTKFLLLQKPTQMHKECQSNSAKKDFMKSGNMKSHGDVSLENCNNFHMHCMNNKTTPFGPLWGNLFLFNLQRKQTHANLHHIYIYSQQEIFIQFAAQPNLQEQHAQEHAAEHTGMHATQKRVQLLL